MSQIIKTLWDPTPFLQTVHEGLKKLKIDISNLPIDHICYRVDSLLSYEGQKQFLDTQGVSLSEESIGWRSIATYKLHTPLIYKDKEIPCIELPAPKDGSPYIEWWEHIECVTGEPLENFLKRYPDVSFNKRGFAKKSNRDVFINLTSIVRSETKIVVKFHEKPLEDVIRIERGLVS